jgi:hypothetical protein
LGWIHFFEVFDSQATELGLSHGKNILSRCELTLSLQIGETEATHFRWPCEGAWSSVISHGGCTEEQGRWPRRSGGAASVASRAWRSSASTGSSATASQAQREESQGLTSAEGAASASARAKGVASTSARARGSGTGVRAGSCDHRNQNRPLAR